MFDENPILTEDAPTVFIVSQQCINKGNPNKSKECMIAKALLDQGCEDPHVKSIGIVRFTWKGKRYIGSCDALIDRIYAFDHEEKVKPFIFHLEGLKGFDIECCQDMKRLISYSEDLSNIKRHLWRCAPFKSKQKEPNDE